MGKGTCKHFNGLQNMTCNAGVGYEVMWPGGPKPCIQYIQKSARGGTYLRPGESPATIEPFPGAAKATPCKLYQEPTTEKEEADREEDEKFLQKTIAALGIANAWRVKPKPQVDRREVVKCPVCSGSLHLYQSAYNGHVHGTCDTTHCVSWVE